MNCEEFLFILKLKQVTNFLYLPDIVELASACQTINIFLRPLISKYFIISTTKYEKNAQPGQNTIKFEIEANQYLKKKSNTLKVLKIVKYPSFYKIHLDWGELYNLTSITFTGTFKLTELNKLISSSKGLKILSLLKITVTDNESKADNPSYVKLPPTLISLNIDSFMWIMSDLNPYSDLKHSELGKFLFGSELNLPNLDSLYCIQFSRGQKNLLNFLLAKSPNLTKLETRFDIINQTTYGLLNAQCSSLIGLKLKFNGELIITEETLNSYKYAEDVDLLSLLGNVWNNLIYAYLACKCCPNLTELSLQSNFIDINSLNQVLTLLPQIEKLSLINYFNWIDIRNLKFSNSTIKHLVLSKLETIDLSNLIKYLESWTKLKHISIESSEEGKAVNIDGDLKLELSLKPWKYFVFSNSIQLWLDYAKS
jgi:hypothetical protein